jgi:hypothetical protein
MFEGLLEVSIPAIYITCTEREMIRRIQQRARPAERNLRQGDQKTFPTLRDVSLSLASNTPSTSREEWIVTQFYTTSISSTPRTFPRSEWPRKFWSGIVYFIDPVFHANTLVRRRFPFVGARLKKFVIKPKKTLLLVYD